MQDHFGIENHMAIGHDDGPAAERDIDNYDDYANRTNRFVDYTTTLQLKCAQPAATVDGPINYGAFQREQAA